MKNDGIIKINYSDIKIYEFGKIIYIYNVKYRSVVKISSDVFSIIKKAEEYELKYNQLLDSFINDKDKNYIINLLKILNKNKIICGCFSENYHNITDIQSKDLYLCITDSCNLSCKHCFSSCDSVDKSQMDVEILINLLPFLKKIKIRSLVITGGEPLTNQNFYKIVKILKYNLDYDNLILSTNGTLIDNLCADFICKNFNKIDISIDGYDEKSCSYIRGKGVFDKVIQSVRLLQLKGMRHITLSMVFFEKNIDKIHDFRLLNKTLGTVPIERHFIPFGRGLKNIELFCKENTRISNSIPLLIKRSINENDSFRLLPFSCNAGNGQLFINYDGNIFPCPSLVTEEYCLGNAFDFSGVSVDIAIENSKGYKNLIELFPYNFTKCNSCKYSIFCLKCPARVNDIKNNSLNYKQWCNLMSEIFFSKYCEVIL
ncbi:radical SAM/SPASM domain-containing protein [Peptostreptococcus porci]|uniref:radical SAM/SPASM domain-containing protein n=1 Tax=Peptostreptococcus porci TaxID=2652282 RepID=UPI002A817992|nr:radical SAM protein [Peptostreptococcus porci]MDY4129020.1 radical SAM protein [Peptostreptococcus porci]MDY5436437.1 radical SAM protein [Peptostreptococcus porci]